MFVLIGSMGSVTSKNSIRPCMFFKSRFNSKFLACGVIERMNANASDSPITKSLINARNMKWGNNKAETVGSVAQIAGLQPRCLRFIHNGKLATCTTYL